MDDVDGDGRILCATYTHARRHPMVLGHIGGWTPPVQLSVQQIVVLIVVTWLETTTWRWWGAPLPRSLSVLMAMAMPVLAAWLARRVRVEGRSLARAVLGWLTWLVSQGPGRVGGRPHRVPRRAMTLESTAVYVHPGAAGQVSRSRSHRA
jgi:hypothetical protein